MDVMLLNRKVYVDDEDNKTVGFEVDQVVDIYTSLIWTDRFDECGDFELHIPLEHPLVTKIKKGQYLYNPESEHLMIIDTIKIDLKADSLDDCVISGRSLESLLDRRIVWNQTVFKAVLNADGINYDRPKLQDCIKKLLDDNIIKPTITVRSIDNFIFEMSDDPKIVDLELEAKYYGEDLYSIITSLCKENEIGFKITINESNQFVFKLVAGVDRSFAQTVNPYVIFSPSYDNLLKSNYIDSDQNLKNVTLIAGEDDEDPNKEDDIIPKITYELELYGTHGGLDRREIFTDASDVTFDTGEDDITLTYDQYEACLRQRGIDTLIENSLIKAFDGEVDPNRTFKYGVDYFIGDTVQIVNEYGHEGTAYISEFIWSYSDSGISAYPTFKTIQKGIYEE